MDFKPRQRADVFTHPASEKQLKLVFEQTQKRLKASFSEDRKRGSDLEEANLVLNAYGFTAYEEGYRSGLSELKKEGVEVKIKRRNAKQITYEPRDAKKLGRLAMRRYESKRLRKRIYEHDREEGISRGNEERLLLMVINTFFEAGYCAAAMDTENIFKSIHPENPDKASALSEIFDEVMAQVAEKL